MYTVGTGNTLVNNYANQQLHKPMTFPTQAITFCDFVCGSQSNLFNFTSTPMPRQPSMTPRRFFYCFWGLFFLPKCTGHPPPTHTHTFPQLYLISFRFVPLQKRAVTNYHSSQKLQSHFTFPTFSAFLTIWPVVETDALDVVSSSALFPGTMPNRVVFVGVPKSPKLPQILVTV